MLDTKFWMKEDDDLHTDHLWNSFKFIQPKAQNLCKYFLLLAISLYLTQQIWKFYIFVISSNKSFLSQVLRVTGRLGEKFNFFSPLGFDIQRDSDHETTKIKFFFHRVLKQYLSKKNRIHGRKIATIWKVTAQNFQTYFKYGLRGRKKVQDKFYSLFKQKVLLWPKVRPKISNGAIPKMKICRGSYTYWQLVQKTLFSSHTIGHQMWKKKMYSISFIEEII